MPFANIDRRKIYYETYEKGEWIILLHHGFGCTKMWKDVFPSLVNAGYGIIMYDRRGYGRSERGEGFSSFFESDEFREESVQDLSLLLKHLNADSFHLVGQCEGGVIAIDYANSHPEQVKTVTVSGTVYLDGSPMEGISVNFEKSVDHFGADETDAAGKYEVQAEPGKNNVFFSKTEGLSEEDEEMAEMEEMGAVDEEGGDEPEPDEGQVIPAKYQDRENPAVTYDVPEGGATNADFKLTTDGGEPKE